MSAVCNIQLPDRASKLGHGASWLSGSWEVQLTSLALWAVLHVAVVNEGKDLYFGRTEGVSVGGLVPIIEKPVSLECGGWKCSRGSTLFPVSCCLPLSASHTLSFTSGCPSRLLLWALHQMVSSVILYLGYLNLNSQCPPMSRGYYYLEKT